MVQTGCIRILQKIQTSPARRNNQTPTTSNNISPSCTQDLCSVPMARGKKKTRRCPLEDLSFSARLPPDVRGDFANSICAVKQSSDPLVDFQQSISEIIGEFGVHDWEEMEELVYCYLALNSEDVRGVIADAFLSICSSLPPHLL